jgi:hypothetical protein
VLVGYVGGKKMKKFLRILVAVVLLAQFSAWAVNEIAPSGDNDVLEVLPAITRNRLTLVSQANQVADPATTAAAARQDIAMARQTGETRYWGRAQAVLAPWWDQGTAPTEIAVLQATVQQGRHEFDAARKVLVSALTRAPGHAQGWLNLAALERLSANYQASLTSCEAVARAGQALYASACRLETQSLMGSHQLALQGLQGLLAKAAAADQRSWLLSLLAESQERAGHDGPAAQAYQLSLALQADLYTSIAYSDLLLRTARTSQALQVLSTLPETDAVLLRRAAAWKRLGDAKWLAARATLQERNAELVRRGDDPALHGRELALQALWLDGNPSHALALAKNNLRLQREPLDWWVALQSARLAGDSAALTEISAAMDATGLQDLRLKALLQGADSKSRGARK